MRLAVITDIHEDIQSLIKTLKLIEKLSCDEIICLGDICGFSIPYYTYYDSRNANECVRLIRENCKYSVIGNHDLYAIRKLPENIDGFLFPKDWYKKNYFEKLLISQDKIWLYEENELNALLDDKNLEYLNSLPEFFSIELKDKVLYFAHYLYPDLTGTTKDFIYDYKDFLIHHERVRTTIHTICFFGHMHPSGIIKIKNHDMSVTKKAIKNTKNILGLSGPCITQNERMNGFMIFDVENDVVSPYYLRKTLQI